MYIIYTKDNMENKMISARVELDDYSNRVIGVIKAKFGLNDKSEALNKFIELYGDDIIEKEATIEYTKKAIKIANSHYKKYGKKKMSLAELDRICEE
ncbi:MAG: DUF2683 family protein [Nanoarchaeota archaeon]|nr:DUF2683 family protein [Nanoarchaeota archaeon]